MQRLLGKQNNSVRYFHQGYVYYLDNRGHGTIFRCSLRNSQLCRAVAYVNSLDDLENQPVTLYEQHNHSADHNLPLRDRFNAEIMQSALSWEDPKSIFDRLRAKDEYRPIADTLSFYTEYKQKIEKARKAHTPPTPRSLEQLGEMLQEYPLLQHLYQGTIQGADGSQGVILMDEGMREPLSQCKHLYADGTFKMKSLIPGFQQIYTIHFRKLDSGFPAIIVFASSQTTQMYNAIWTKVLEMIPELKENVTTIMGDFESAQINSFKANFPESRICGCLFHYKAAIAKKWASLKIIGCEFILEKAYALAHLPAAEIPIGAQHITDLIDREEQLNLQRFGVYLRRYWVPLKDVLSVYKNPVRTNNTCENFHLHACRRVGVHEHIWKMISALSKVMSTAVANYRSLTAGGRYRNWRPLDLQIADGAIKRYEMEFELNRMSVEEFLTSIANLRRMHLARVFHYDETQQTSDNLRDGEEVFLNGNLNATPGSSGFVENQLLFRRRRRIHEIFDRQLMPNAPPPRAPNRLRNAMPRQQLNAPDAQATVEPLVLPRRARGRPRRVAEIPQREEPIHVGEGGIRIEANEVADEVVVEPVVPPRRPRGRPRRIAPPLPLQAENRRERIVTEAPEAENAQDVLLESEEPPELPELNIGADDLFMNEVVVEEHERANEGIQIPTDVETRTSPIHRNQEEPVAKKAKTRRGGANKKCCICQSRGTLHKLRPCQHRICAGCIRNLIARQCPFCRTGISSYLPNHMMGGERWNNGEVEEIEVAWHEQLLREFAAER